MNSTLKDLRAIKGKYYIGRLIEEGEHEHQDFKFAISDAHKIARTISAFANNGGGRLLIGVKDNGRIAGVRNEEDIFVIQQAAEMYCRPCQDVEVKAFATGGGAIVIVVEIRRSDRRPVQAQEPDGRWRSYYRVKDENILASPLMENAWKMEETDSGAFIAFDGPERQLLAILAEQETVTLTDFMRRAHISRLRAEEAVGRLCSSRMVDFSYTGNEFALVATRLEPAG